MLSAGKPEGSSDVVPCPDVVSYIDSHFDCRNLLQRSVIHHGAEREASSTIISAARSGRQTETVCCACISRALPKIEAPRLVCFPIETGGFYIGREHQSRLIDAGQ